MAQSCWIPIQWTEKSPGFGQDVKLGFVKERKEEWAADRDTRPAGLWQTDFPILASLPTFQ